MKGLTMYAFPDFDKDVRLPFAVHENCYDCAEFYQGCTGWRVPREFTCGAFNKLPDVLPGTYGQVFPAPSRATEPLLIPNDSTPGKMDADSTPKEKVRACSCGTPLPKGKQFCDRCRRQSRQQTKRGYMRTYMRKRRAADEAA